MSYAHCLWRGYGSLPRAARDAKIHGGRPIDTEQLASFGNYSSGPLKAGKACSCLVDFDLWPLALQDVRPAPPGTHKIREPSGESTVVPDTAHLAPEHGATLLVPAQRGAVPDGPASFAVHKTPQADLRWLTRVTSQRTSGNVPIRGPGEVPYFEAKCPEFGESRGSLTTTGVQ